MIKLLQHSAFINGMRKRGVQLPQPLICSHFSASAGPSAKSPTPTHSSSATTNPQSLSNASDEGVVTTDEELQPQWRALENRVSSRRSRVVGTAQQGRSPRRGSAWDHECV